MAGRWGNQGGRARHKFNAVHVERDGWRFDSKAEGRYYDKLQQRVAEGEVLFFLRQVPLHLPGKTKLVIDFVEFHEDGSCHFVDVKGMQTEQFKLKRRQVEALYPIEIEVVR